MKVLKAVACLGAFVVFPHAVMAQPTSREVCQKMINEGRNGSFSFANCECTYRVADAVLDEDIKALLFDSWYNGNDNMAKMEQLPKPGRVRRQLRVMQRSLKKNCDLSL